MATQLIRKFKLKDTVLPDPDPTMSEKLVKEFYANQYPELINANIGAPSYTETEVIYSFETNVGTKG
jgi:PRTRC genetic system protein C